MTNEELLQELEQLVVALEDSFAVVTGVVAETGDPVATLRQLVAAKDAIGIARGKNGWRDRLLRSSVKIAAMKAAPHAGDDPALQTLIAISLGGDVSPEPMH